MLSPIAVLKDEALSTSGGLQKSRLAAGLVVTQVALSLVLLISAGLLVRSLEKAQEANPGFDPNHVFLASFDLAPLGYSDAKGIELERQLQARLRALPGVESATIADFSPLSFTIHSNGVQPEGYLPRPHETMEVDWGRVGPDYLRTLRTPLLAGRDFNGRDNRDGRPVAIVNQAFVDRYWPGHSGIGKRILLGMQWTEVVGVAANGKYRRLTYDATPLVLVPLLQSYESEAIIHVRAAGEPLALAPEVERTVAELDPNLPLFNETTLKTSMQFGNVFERVAVVLAGTFGLLALILANVGIYAVISYTTRQRTHEIGIRMALGAGQSDIFRQVLAQGLRLTLIGLTVGVASCLVVTRFLRDMLFGVGATDLLTFVTVAALLCVVALAACYIPAWRASKVQPITALHCE
jgi:predicted permease